MKYFFAILLVLTASVILYTNAPQFGGLPSRASLERIRNSPNYKNGQFHNIGHDVRCDTLNAAKVIGLFKAFCNIVKNQNCFVPSIKTDLLALRKDENVLVWLGHSSYFIQIGGIRVLVDPVLSDVSSPIPFFPKALPGSNVYKPQDIPEVDYLIITHDHWDHLDYQAVKKLKFKTVICPLGVGGHFERWNFKSIIEMDWYETIKLDCGFVLHCLPSKHFSGRCFLRNRTLWASFLLETPSQFKIFIGGDGGYDSRFAKFGRIYGRINLAILENGQYNENWQSIHMRPEETLKAAEELNAEALLPVHTAKFTLAPHKWNEPLQRISKLSNNKDIRVLTPMIGQIVNLKSKNQTFEKWWDETL
ncbi:MAG: MBL fold metallo-hydrolase [Holosporales bacterium]|jgi:L-ascorbate metabolism protein UlaG (beta-lactamase superfamily)|nr:MBL fold metallo-hydrolase [Holosporales bacterium]